MGEYAKRKTDHEEVKIGTCESMYYLRVEDVDKVIHIHGNIDPSTENDLFFRLPLPEEDHVMVGNYDGNIAVYRLYREVLDYHGKVEGYEDFTADDLIEQAGTLQLRHESGLLINIPCHHGVKLPDMKGVFWSGKSWFIELRFIKRTSGKLKPVIWCRHCERMWSCDWENIIDYCRGEFKRRMVAYSQV